MGIVFIAALFASSQVAKAPEDSRIRSIIVTEATRGTPIVLHVAPNTITSVRFSKPIDIHSVKFGDPSRFGGSPQQDIQIDLRALSDKYGYTSNLNVVTQTGEGLSFELVIVEPKHADVFVSVALELSDDAEDKHSCDSRIFAAKQDAQAKAELELLHDVIKGVTYRRLDERAVTYGVILRVIDFIKLGNKGLMHFSIDNQSRDGWASGSIKLTFSVNGQKPNVIDTAAIFAESVVSRGDEVSGSLSFDMFDVPANATFSVQAFEKNGARSPEVAGVRF